MSRSHPTGCGDEAEGGGEADSQASGSGGRADCLKPLPTHQGLGGEEQVGCRQESGPRGGYAEFWMPMATSGGDAQQAFGELSWALSAFG